MAVVRRFAIASLLLLGILLLGTPAFAQLPAELAEMPAEERAELAESYYLAGLQYREVGNLEMAEGMTKLAFTLNPDLDPEAIAEPQLPTVDELPPPPDAVEGDDSGTAWTSQVMVSRLLRLASAFLAEDADAIVAALDGSIYLAGVDVTRAQAHAALQGLFDRVSLAGLTLAEIYDTDSIVVEPYAAADGALADALQVTVTARVDLSAEVPFWSAEQRFVLRSVADTWLVSAVLSGSSEQPPTNWSPAAMEPDTAAERRMHAAVAREQDSAAQQAVAQTLLRGADRFLDKDTDGVLAVVDSSIRLPDGSSLARESLRAMLDFYFGRTPYRGLRARDVITVGPIEPLDPSADGAARYRAEVSFEEPYQEALPSIRPGQRFDLRHADGRWLVVAIS